MSTLTGPDHEDHETSRGGREGAFTEVVLGALDEGAAVAREDAGHGGLALAGELVVGVGLLDREAGGVHVPPQHDLPLSLHHLRGQLLGQRRRGGLLAEPRGSWRRHSIRDGARHGRRRGRLERGRGSGSVDWRRRRRGRDPVDRKSVV